MTFSPIRKANVVFDALEAQGIEFPSVPIRVEQDNPYGTVRIDMNMDTFNDEPHEQLRALIPVNFTYDERAYAYRGTGNLLGINVLFRFFIDTQAFEEAK